VRPHSILTGRPGRLVSAALALALGSLALVVLVGLPGATSRASAQGGGEEAGEVTPQTDASLPATRVTMIGSAPKEAADETWGLGLNRAGESVLVRYTPETGWTLGPALLDAGGQPLSGFKLDQPEAFRFGSPSPLAGAMTEDGSGVLAGEVPAAAPSETKTTPVLLVRNPGGAFQETAPLPSTGEAALQKGERLFGVNRAPMIAALEEAGGRAGALVAPVTEGAEGAEDRVLHWNGEAWSSESIEVPTESKGELEVLAIGASSPENAWLLARLSAKHYPAGSVVLFRRHVGAGAEPTTWQLVAPTATGEPVPLEVPTQNKEEAQFIVPSAYQSQVLTVTEAGVWLDGERADVQSSTTMFFKPEGEAHGHVVGHVLESWCKLSEAVPAGTQPCDQELPEALPSADVRSFAWPDSSELGKRVMTGFPEGVSLRLEPNGTFKRVLALGGSSNPDQNVGTTFGAAFSSAREGWLGQLQLPVHLTQRPIESRLKPWPTPFRHALLALAPAPGAPVGSLSSEALAVGDEGEVARYAPGKGWLPESLLGPGGRHETPRLRAVAWPTPSRAYAVGDRGQMWLWRGETGLWEADPAEPLNFRGDLLGIAFDPEEPARGYAVGESGVLLRYGKTWTQEPESEIPAPARGASFTSIAFAGGEAIVAYRKLIPSTERFEGGLIVNNGSGWHADEGAAAVIGASAPWAVAALPEGGAAFSTRAGQIFERQGPGDPWQETPTPYPGETAPGSLALFREGQALRVVTVGSEPDTVEQESEPSPPAGFPPNLVQPYPLASDQETGVLRQTATGWSDEEHELNNAEEGEGGYRNYDAVYKPDPVAAVLVDPTGSQGWAVGGIAEPVEHSPLDTADVWRYPSTSAEQPLGVKQEAITVESPLAGAARFAIGGAAQCAAPCAARAEAKIGPDQWLEHALQQAASIAGMSAFLYTGPRVTTGETVGPATIAVPYRREEERYAEILGQRPGGIAAYAGASPSDLDRALSDPEQLFEEAFSGYQGAAPGVEAAGHSGESGHAAYYALVSKGVRVVVLDDSTNVEAAQLQWLKEELEAAEAKREPAIVVGNADLQAQISARDASAASVAEVLARQHASAYFFDSPEKDVKGELTVATGAGTVEVPTYGSGTLGYINANEQAQSDFIGASGFLLAEIGKLSSVTKLAPVHVTLIPDIGELAMEAEQGTLLRRSQPARFDALARRPRAGGEAANGSKATETDPYIPIPLDCVGSACASGLEPEYSFSSSNPEVGSFVKQDPAEPTGLEPLFNSKDEPERENPADAKSGLFCAFNAGTTTVTISAGGLAYSLPVTVEAGSVRQPCGTVPAAKVAAAQQAAPVPAPPPTPAPAAAAPASSAPPAVPVPAPPVTVPAPPARPTPAPPPFFLTPAPPAFVLAFVPPPVPTPARPTPPSGTSAVTSPVEAAEREEESEAAPESVSNEAVAYRAPEHEPSPVYLLGLVVLAAFAGASIRRRPRRGEREVRIAPATISTMRTQRRMTGRRGQRW
jgi:hypothetical protein